jgi:LPXTG-motif cell wall-anchored protein
VRVVGRNGEPVAEARNGGRLYFEVPEKGTATGMSSLTVQAATKVPVGRAFTGVGGSASSQAQILAGSSRSTVSATATVSWARGGAMPTVAAQKNCARGGVKVTVANAGDRPYAFRLAGKKDEAAARSSTTTTVPVEEDQAYRIPVTGSGGLKKTVTGVLDCATRSATPAQDEERIATQSHTASAGGSDAGIDAADSGGDLAETGSSSNTPLILGIAVGLVILGAVALLAVRRRRPGADPERTGEE